MLTLFYLTLLTALPIGRVLGGQVPIVDGVLGGVSSTTSSTKPELLKVAATTPGKLRVTENSGICGEASEADDRK